MLRSEDFSAAVKSGVRAGSRRLVLHYRAGEAGDVHPALVGVVVPKKQVARATHRNRIKRRVRALMSDRVEAFPAGSRVVVRALAGADGASSDELGRDLDRLIERTHDKAQEKAHHKVAMGVEYARAEPAAVERQQGESAAAGSAAADAHASDTASVAATAAAQASVEASHEVGLR